MSITIGVYIGQKRDPAADKRPDEYHSLVRYLPRFPLGTPNSAVAERVVKIFAARSRSDRTPTL